MICFHCYVVLLYWKYTYLKTNTLQQLPAFEEGVSNLLWNINLFIWMSTASFKFLKYCVIISLNSILIPFLLQISLVGGVVLCLDFKAHRWILVGCNHVLLYFYTLQICNFINIVILICDIFSVSALQVWFQVSLSFSVSQLFDSSANSLIVS